ncbi:hypothetical protein MLD38_039079 [Melastoma candidum]|uniref:Uncharacterized protein n=1 Tax=Melastoma candidum TaxID=119954 RepID=A0ACB9L1Z5_9MYRT|nr:hypothetical protein MLD38_039079 [Melastoma candidum]
MDVLNVSLSSDAYASLIKECTSLRDPEGSFELLRHLRRSGLRPSSDLLNRVLLMFVSCDRTDVAVQVFDEMPDQDFNSWSILVVGCMECGDYDEAMRVFMRMCFRLDMSQTPVWLVACVLDACVKGMNMEAGEQIHGWLLKQDRYHDDLVFAMLFKLYGRFHQLQRANSVFDQISGHTMWIWTEKMANDLRGGDYVEVVNDFKELGRFRKGCNTTTLCNTIKACGRMNDAGKIGLQVHAKAIKAGMEEDEIVVGRLVGMYGQFGMLKNARTVFDKVSDCRNIRCWKDMIKGYAQHGMPVEAIKLLYQMKVRGLEVDEHLLHEVRVAAGSWM